MFVGGSRERMDVEERRRDDGGHRVRDAERHRPAEGRRDADDIFLRNPTPSAPSAAPCERHPAVVRGHTVRILHARDGLREKHAQIS